MSNANIAAVQNLYAAFGRGDIDTIIAGSAPDIDWQTVGRKSDYPAFGPRKGAAQVQEFFQIIADNEEFSDFSPREFYAADDKGDATHAKGVARRVIARRIHFVIGPYNSSVGIANLGLYRRHHAGPGQVDGPRHERPARAWCSRSGRHAVPQSCPAR